MAEGMGHRAINCQGRSYADTAHHEAHLVDQAVGQHPADIVLQYRIENRNRRHHGPQPDQKFSSRKHPGHQVDCTFGGKGTQEDGAGNGRLRVGVTQPGVQRRDGGVDRNTEKDKVGIDAGKVHQAEFRGSGSLNVQYYSGQQAQPAKYMHQYIAYGSGLGGPGPPGQNQKSGGHGHNLPEDIERKDIPGKGHSQGSAGIGKSGAELECCRRC